MSKKKGKQTQQIENYSQFYSICSELGEGGNAKVFLAEDKQTKEKVALKVLINRKEESELRFKDEIETMCKYSALKDGVMPIYKSDIENCWYSMPVAVRISNHIGSGNINNRCEIVVNLMLGLCSTLEYLHANGVSHRDIKPDNLYLYNDVPCFGDFGLVDFPDKDNNLTRNDKGLGAIFTIAPEMKRDPVGKDGKMADVYSMAKTMWMLLTQDEKGFDGQYNCVDETHRLHAYEHLHNEYLVEIERLMKKATDNDPSKRPTISEFKSMLEEWLKFRDSDSANQREWEFLNDCIFNGRTPKSAEFDKLEEIVEILNYIGSSPAYNHMLFGESGGLDFDRAEKANEEGCIYLINKPFVSIIKPKALYFESFNDTKWNYFLLDIEELVPIFSQSPRGDEELVEDYPGHYVNADNVVYGVYDYDTGEKLPEGYKHVYRYCTGRFLVVLKDSPYNQMPGTYDGRHALCTSVEFKDYITKLKDTYDRLIAEGASNDAIVYNRTFNQNPFECRKCDISLPKANATKLPDATEFISKEFVNWNFKDILDKRGDVQYNLAYYYKIHVNDCGYSPFERFFDYWYLGEDGSLKRTEEGKMTNQVAYIHGFEQAILIKSLIEQRVLDICNGFDPDSVSSQFYIDIRFERIQMPSHLFTVEEIADAMRSADDRISNKLVIDADGYAHVVPFETPAQLYPVVHEAWGGYKNYVGKYSNLNVLDSFYKDSLYCWLEYLKTGEYQYSDYNKHVEEEKILKEILKYYKT